MKKSNTQGTERKEEMLDRTLKHEQIEELETQGKLIPEEVLNSITTPDTVETRLGTLRFTDGVPSEETAQKLYDNLDFMRAVQVFVNTCNGASLVAMREAMREIGAVD